MFYTRKQKIRKLRTEQRKFMVAIIREMRLYHETGDKEHGKTAIILFHEGWKPITHEIYDLIDPDRVRVPVRDDGTMLKMLLNQIGKRRKDER